MSGGAEINRFSYINQLPALVPTLPQKISFTASSTPSAAFDRVTTCIRIFPTQDCYIKFGSNPTATTSDIFCPGGVIQYFGIISDQNTKLSVIRDSANGTLHIFEGL